MADFELCFSIRKEFLKNKVSGEIAFELISFFHVQIQEPTSRSTTTRAFDFVEKFMDGKIFETRSWWRPKRFCNSGNGLLDGDDIFKTLHYGYGMKDSKIALIQVDTNNSYYWRLDFKYYQLLFYSVSQWSHDNVALF